MGILEKLHLRSQPTNDIQNPCPIDPQPTTQGQPMSLSNLMRQFKGDAMNLSPFFAGVNMISNSLAMMSWLFKNQYDEILPDTNYLYYLFTDAKMTRFNMMKNVITDLILHGNGFIYIERDHETGKPRTLHYSPANQTLLYYNPISYDIYFMNPAFSTHWDDGTNYLHFYMNTRDGYNGTPIRDYAYKTIQLAGNTEKAKSDYYSSGGQLFGLVTVNETTPMVGVRDSSMAQLRQTWDEARAQAEGTGTIFVPADLKYQQLSSTAKDSEFIEASEYNITDIARFLNISPVLLGDLRHNTYGTLSESQREFLLHTLFPYVKMIEEEATRKLVMPSKQGTYFIDLDENAILATDAEKQANYYQKLVQAGIMTVNEARGALGLPKVDGGDRLMVAYSNVDSNTIGETTQN